VESLKFGIQLTVFGMGLVFLLLAVMALFIALLLRLDRTAPVVEKLPDRVPCRPRCRSPDRHHHRRNDASGRAPAKRLRLPCASIGRARDPVAG